MLHCIPLNCKLKAFKNISDIVKEGVDFRNVHIPKSLFSVMSKSLLSLFSSVPVLPKIHSSTLNMPWHLVLGTACSLKGLFQWLNFIFLTYYSSSNIEVSHLCFTMKIYILWCLFQSVALSLSTCNNVSFGFIL
jgi:hypothetical protein